MSLVKYQNWAVNEAGNVIASSAYEVRDTAGVLVSIYSDAVGTAASNPGTASSSGLIEFYADKGVYDITVGGGPSATTQRAVIGGPDVAYFASRADAVSAVAAGSAEVDGRSLIFDGSVWYKKVAGATVISDINGWVPLEPYNPEHFGAAGDGVTDDTDALVAWLEVGGTMAANGKYLIAAAGPDSGGCYLYVKNDINFTAGADCEFIAGAGLDNDMFRLQASPSHFQTGHLPKISWVGGKFNQTAQANSTVIPNASDYPPVLQGVSATCDALAIYGYVSISSVEYPAFSEVSVSGVTFYSGDHWEIAGGDSQLFITGVMNVSVVNNVHQGARDCGFYGSTFSSSKGDNIVFNVTGNKYLSCCFGVGLKRQVQNAVISNNFGDNTPHMIAVQGLNGQCSNVLVTDNVCRAGWQLVRLDDVTGALVENNTSHSHGNTLADGSRPTRVYHINNAIVRLQGASECIVKGNVVHSLCTDTPPTDLAAAIIEGGSYITLSEYNKVIDNSLPSGSVAISEVTGEADNNLSGNNTSLDSLHLLDSNFDGASSRNVEDPDYITFTRVTHTGDTATTTLQTATIPSYKLSRRGSVVEVLATGGVTGLGTKDLYFIGGGFYTLLATIPATSSEWMAKITLVQVDGTTLRLLSSVSADNGYTEATKDTTSSYSGDLTFTISGDLSDASGSVSCDLLMV